jgi:hypothetical protein
MLLRTLRLIACVAAFAATASAAAAAGPPPLPPFGGSYVESVCAGVVCQIDNDYYAETGSNFGQHSLNFAGANGLTSGYGSPAVTMLASVTSLSPLVETHAATDLTYWFRFTASDEAAAAALDAYKQSLIDGGALCHGRACRTNTVPVVSISGFYGLSATTGISGQATVIGGSDYESFTRTCGGDGALLANCTIGSWSILAPLTEVYDLTYQGFVHLSADALLPEGYTCAGTCFGKMTAWIDPVISLRSGFADAGAFTLTLDPGLANGAAPPASGAPEPAQWALAVCGFAVAGAVVRRRRARAAHG